MSTTLGYILAHLAIGAVIYAFWRWDKSKNRKGSE